MEDQTLLVFLYHGCVNGSMMLYIIFQNQLAREISYQSLQYVYGIGLLYMIYQYHLLKYQLVHLNSRYYLSAD